MTVEQTRSRATELQGLFPLLRDERGIFDRWEELVSQYEVKGKNTHDARFAAAMLRHGITQVLTFDVRGFKRFGGISVLAPEEF